MNYHRNKNIIPEIVLNIPGTIVIDNKPNKIIKFEIDYNLFTKEQLEKIKNGFELEFANSTKCITYNGKNNYSMENLTYIPIEEDEYIKIKTENNMINFKMIKKNIIIFKDDKKILTTEINHSKQVSLNLADGIYKMKTYIYTIKNELICESEIKLLMITNYYQINDQSSNTSNIVFNENEGNFKLILSANSKKLYSFKITDIISNNDSIFDFSYYNSADNKEITKGKIGAEIQLLNDKQIEEIIKNPSQEQLIKPEFVFDIKEILTTNHTKDDIGIIKIPTIQSKLRDTYSKYYDLKCDVSQSYTVDIDKTDDFLITDKFISEPLFYKSIIDKPFKKIELIDNDNNSVEYFLEKISEDIHIIYFNPFRNKEYFLKIDEHVEHITYKKSYESFKVIYNQSIKTDKSFYFGDLMIKGTGIYEVTITFEDYQKKTFNIKGTNKECKFLEDERVKINNRILSLEINNEFEEIINMICPLKNNRINYSYFKKNNQDFVYIAKEVTNFNIKDIPLNKLNNINLNNKYIFKDNELIEVPNGSIYLEDINKTDIIFTDIETWTKENTISDKQVLQTKIKDDYFADNIVDSTVEVKYENK